MHSPLPLARKEMRAKSCAASYFIASRWPLWRVRVLESITLSRNVVQFRTGVGTQTSEVQLAIVLDPAEGNLKRLSVSHLGLREGVFAFRVTRGDSRSQSSQNVFYLFLK